MHDEMVSTKSLMANDELLKLKARKQDKQYSSMNPRSSMWRYEFLMGTVHYWCQSKAKLKVVRLDEEVKQGLINEGLSPKFWSSEQLETWDQGGEILKGSWCRLEEGGGWGWIGLSKNYNTNGNYHHYRPVRLVGQTS